MRVTIPTPQGRGISTDSFADITSKACVFVGWDAEAQLTADFAEDLTPAEEQAVRRRLRTATAAEETLQERAEQAIALLTSYESLSNPSNGQTAQTVKLLCRVVSALVFLTLRREIAD